MNLPADKNTLSRRFSLIAAGAVVLLTLFLFSSSVNQGLSWIGKPFPGFLPNYYGSISPLSLPYWTGWGKTGQVPIIVEYNSKSFTNAADYLSDINARPIGTLFRYKFYLGDKKLKYAVIPSMRYKLIDFLQIWGISIVMAITFFISGWFVFILRLDKSYHWAVFIFSTVIGSHLLAANIAHTNPVSYFLFILNYSLIGSVLLHLIFSIFEEPEFFRRNPLRYGYIYSISLFITLIDFIAQSERNLTLSYVSYNLIIIYDLIALIAVFILIFFFRYKSNEPLIRHRARLLLLGVFLFALAGIFMSLGIRFGIKFPLIYGYLPMLAIPIAMAYGILRHNLFEIDEIIKRSIIYGSVMLLAALLWAVSFWYFNIYLSGFTFMEDPLFLLLLFIPVLLLLVLIKKQLQSLLDRIFFKTPVDYGEVMKSLSQELSIITDRKKLLESAEDVIREKLMLTNAAVLVESVEKGSYISRDSELVLKQEDEILEIVRSAQGMVTYNQVLNDPALRKVRNRALAQMSRIEARFLMPIYYHANLIGIICLGDRKSAELSLKLTDVRALQLMGSEIAVSLENSRLYQDLTKVKAQLEELNFLLEDKVQTRTKELMAKQVALEDANLRITISVKHKAEFLANMSHELRTPLNGILGYAALILEGSYGEVHPQVREILKELKEAGADLLKYINDILDFSKIEAQRMILMKNPFSPLDLLSQVAAGKIADANKKGIKLRIECSPDIPIGFGDDKRIKQVLINLLDNAIKFSDKGEAVIRAKKDENNIIFEVQDQGVGIPKSRQKLIFSEFQQLEDLREKKHKGIGLGLAISRRLVELHGGSMMVESQMNRGTRIRFTIPLRD